MLETSNTFAMQMFLLCLILAGLISAKARIVDDHARSSLSDLIINVFLPCNILSSFFDTSRSELPSLGIILVISTIILALCFVLSQFVLYRKVGHEQKKVLIYATMISNASFLGNPLVESIFGFEALIYSAAYLVPIRVALWTVGITLFAGGKGKFKKVAFHPCLVATYLGLLLIVTGYAPPPLVSRVFFSLGNCTTPVSMIVVGSILGMVKPKHLITRLMLYYTFIRLIFIPLTVLSALKLLRLDPLITGVAVILSGAPAPVTTSILAEQYGADSELASKIVFLSTMFSIVTIPFLIWMLK